VLFRQAALEGIRTGAITLAFRRWQRPTVKSGGTLLTAIGQLEIGKVEAMDLAAISLPDARRAGFGSLADLHAELGARPGEVYRIELGAVREDPRLALREQQPDSEQLVQLQNKLARLDAHATTPWTGATLRLIKAHPAVRAGTLADHLGMDRLPFKTNVRKLKTLGLTISLGTGYELSPRGHAVLDSLD
jgi:hypothetical protein